MRQLWGVFGELVPAVLVGVPVAVAAWWLLTTRRGRRMPPGRAWRVSLLDVAVAAAVLTVIYLVTVPLPGIERALVSWRPGTVLVNLVDPGTPLLPVLWQLVGNVLLLLPLGALVPLRVRAIRSVPRVAAAAAAVSATIETAQWLLPIGRVTAVDDVLLNTVGAAIGAALTRRWWHGSSPSSAVDPGREPHHPGA